MRKRALQKIKKYFICLRISVKFHIFQVNKTLILENVTYTTESRSTESTSSSTTILSSKYPTSKSIYNSEKIKGKKLPTIGKLVQIYKNIYLKLF